MHSFDTQQDVSRVFDEMLKNGCSDKEAIARIYSENGVGLSYLWRVLADHKGVGRRDAMKLALSYTRDFRDRGQRQNNMAADDKHCPTCGRKLLIVLPDVTTKEDILEYTASAKECNNPPFATSGAWMHAGRYCPKGCVNDMWNIARRDSPPSIDHETSSIIVRIVTPKLLNLSDLKIYIDRYVRRTAQTDTAQHNTEYVRLEPGSHTIIVRDHDHLDPSRRESNMIEFSIDGDHQLEFECAEREGQLEIIIAGEQVAASDR